MLIQIKGYDVLIDDEDADRVLARNWFIKSRSRYVYFGFGRKDTELLHRFLLNIPFGDSRLVDHCNGNTLDNRKANLRVANRSQNLQNSKKRNDNTSGFKGVSWYPKCNKYRAYICYNGKQIFLGLFNDPKEAHAKYCEAAKKIFGEYARMD